MVLVSAGLTAVTVSIAGAAPACENSWTATADGAWNNGANWSLGHEPSATEFACVEPNVARTITLSSTAEPEGFRIGTNATIVLTGSGSLYPLTDSTIDGKVTLGSSGLSLRVRSGVTITNNGTLETPAGITSYISADAGATGLTNTTNGTINNLGNAYFENTSGYTITNNGTWTTAPGTTISQTAPLTTSTAITNGGIWNTTAPLTLTSSGTFCTNPVNIDSTTLTFPPTPTTAPTGCGKFNLNGTVQTTNDIPTGYELTLTGSGSLYPTASMTNNGKVTLGSSGLSLRVRSGVTITNNGTLETPAGITSYISADAGATGLTNTTNGTINNLGNAYFENTSGYTITNNGTWTTAPGTTISQTTPLTTSTAITNGGIWNTTAPLTLTSSGTFCTNPVNIDSTTLTFPPTPTTAPTGCGKFNLNGTVQTTNDIPTGYELTLTGSGSLYPTASMTNNGKVTLGSSGLSLRVRSGVTITNNGTLETPAGITSYISADAGATGLTNTTNGTINNLGNAYFENTSGYTITNNGTWTTAPGTTISQTAPLTTSTAITNGGIWNTTAPLTLTSSGTFCTNPVNIDSTTLTFPPTPTTAPTGCGKFNLNGTVQTTNDIPTGYELTLTGSGSLYPTASMTNNGKVTLGSSGLSLRVRSGVTITNNGTLETPAGITSYISADAGATGLTNTTNGTINNLGNAYFENTSGYTITNNGTWIVDATATTSSKVTQTAKFVNGSTGTLEFVLGSATKFGNWESSNDFIRGGTLRPKPISGFVPALNSTFNIVTGSASLGTGSYANVRNGFGVATTAMPTQIRYQQTSPGASTVSATPPRVIADGSSVSTITVTLRSIDTPAAPIRDKLVSIAASGGNSIITNISTITDANGRATFTVKDSDVEALTYTATNATDGIAVTQTAAVSFVPGPVTSADSTITTSHVTRNADDTQTATITVTLKDAYNHPVSDEATSLVVTPGTATISPSSVVTNAAGRAVFTIRSAAVGSVTITATATTDSVTITPAVPVTVTFVDVTPPAWAPGSLTVNPTDFVADGSATLTATPTDNVAVTRVDFYEGTTLLASDSTAPFTHVVSYEVANNGVHTYSAKAFDAAGLESTATPVSVNVAITTTSTPTSTPTSTSSSSTTTSTSSTTTSTSTSTSTTIPSSSSTSSSTTPTTITAAATTPPIVPAPVVVQPATTVATTTTVVRDTEPPVVKLRASTQKLTSPGAIELVADATDNVRVYSILLSGRKDIPNQPSIPKTFAYVGGGRLSEKVSFTAADNGTWVFEAIASDAFSGGNTGTSSLLIEVAIPTGDNTPPSVQITKTMKTNAGIVITVSAQDASGIKEIILHENGKRVSQMSGSGTLVWVRTFTFNDNGTYRYDAVVTDRSPTPRETVKGLDHQVNLANKPILTIAGNSQPFRNGQAQTLTFTTTNHGGRTATSPSLTVLLPPDVLYSSPSVRGGVCVAQTASSRTGRTVSCRVPNLAPNDSASVSFNVTPSTTKQELFFPGTVSSGTGTTASTASGSPCTAAASRTNPNSCARLFRP